MAKFCGKCGTKLDEVTKLCPKCDAEKIKKISVQDQSAEAPEPIQEDHKSPEGVLSKKETKKKQKSEKKTAKKAKKNDRKAQKKAAKKAKRAQWSIGKKIRRFCLKLLIWVMIIIALGSIVVVGLSYYRIVNIPIVDDILTIIGLETETEDSPEKYYADAPDAESYYEENADIVSKIDAKDSIDVPTEDEICVELISRGFEGDSITTEYDMDGTYSEPIDISNSSSDKHPVYQMDYLSKNGDLWNISVINGSVLANPVSYNIQSNLNVQVIVSEKDTIMSYDSTTNKFYETIPNESALIVIHVDTINAETLDSLTIGEIDQHVQK